jgi:ATP-dependent Lon protease
VSEHEKNIVTLPVLPLKNSVLFPHLLMPLSVGRPHSLAAVESALATEDKEILIVAQRDATVDTPQPQDLYTVGTKAVIKKMARPTDVLTELIVMGVERVMIIKVDEVENHMRAQVRTLPVENETNPETEALFRAVVDLATKAIQLSNPQESVDLRRMLAMNDDPLRLVYMLGSMLSLDLPKEQSLLEANTQRDALRLMHAYLGHEVQVLEIRSKIASEAQSEMSKEQREYLLRQQLRAIQQELGEKNQPGRQGAHPVLRRSAGRGQDQSGPVHCARSGTQVRADERWRPARRGRTARPPPHLHRRDGGPPDSGDAARGRGEPGADAR